ncbi:LemA protein [Dongia mobilis]|uniref:LemA protein n=1 Tax=Dongia mobilis TaxID=578943 RepID=A0A4R6WXU0_9PROT|nr:LemA family protein [Dongia mobilis]TDQ84253.1 LemA protein [Dongia mobilis]
MAFWIVLGLIVAIGFWGVSLYNRLVRLKTQVANGWAQIDVQLKRRYDLIPNLVESVKDYMGYEQETLRQVIEARNSAVKANAGTATPSAASLNAESALTASLGRLFALSENYPNLKANETVQQLMEELSSTENKIGFARQFYNDSATAYNTAVLSFPDNLIAGRFGFEQATLWQVAEAERAAVEAAPKVDLR